ncbi:head GIN domain-containing protein [Xanthovirga aplysinae]|uniref:head GIN domain-containing protein n=1 Tax=Xanthovirga aplysinae TaxID=2529853 RepID=UPI0012BB9237|nr:head GIN domain-containing protein [Xanthovirga aplysinae]MTI33147.1 DUF2807 domain-containing protein [Xanthovirga aplysinae]
MKTMYIIKSIFIPLGVLILLNSCGIKGEGEVVSQTLSLEPFDVLQLNLDNVDVFLKQDTEQKVTVSGQQNIIDNLNTNVKDNKWEIDVQKNTRSYERLTVYISVPELKEIKVTAGGNVFTETPFVNLNHLNLEMNADGQMNLDVEANSINAKVDADGEIGIRGTADEIFCDMNASGKISFSALQSKNIEAEIRGDGNISLEGTTQNLNLDSNAGGGLDAFDLESTNATILIRASGDANVTVQEKLNVTIKASGDVYYKGRPIINPDISASGKLYDANEN